MRTQQSVLERARQGDPEAIAVLINDSLDCQDTTAKTSLEGDCLRIMLEAAEVPDQQTMLKFIRDGMIRLKAAPIQTVQLYGRQIGEAVPAWEASFDLVAPIPFVQASDPVGQVSQQVEQFTPSNSTGLLRFSPRFTSTGMVAIAVLIAVNLVWGFRSIFWLSGESQAYANEAIPGIVGSWNADALIGRASPELLQLEPQLDLKQSFSKLSRELGELQQYQGAVCNVNSSLTKAGMTTSQCHATLVFEKASARVEIQIVRQGDQWQIDRFQVDSDAPLAPQ